MLHSVTNRSPEVESENMTNISEIRKIEQTFLDVRSGF